MRLLTFALCLSAAAAPLGAQSVDATIDRAVSAWSKIKTVRGTFEQTVTNPLTGSSASASGVYQQARPNRLAIRFTQGAEGAIVSDGEALWIYLPNSAPGRVIKRPATDHASMPIDLTGQFLESPRAKYTIADAGTHPVDGHAAHGLVLTPKAGHDAPFTRAVVWVDDDDSLIREFETTETSGVTRRVHLTSIEPNASVAADVFRFSVPKGVTVVEGERPE
ncbi:MAG TPA: outer membrane lipoprotein chaperone LolA [Gemmatimonadaceae bacterium]|nr:outer membrane lipoprotein chaperone LolA [Gemmatimonadaceae bacterium]